MARLGDILTEIGGSSPSQRRHAEELKAHYPDTPIGEIFTNHAGVGAQDVARAVALQNNVPAVWFNQTPPDETLFSEADIEHYIAYDAIPWRFEGKHIIMATSRPCPALKQWAQKH